MDTRDLCRYPQQRYATGEPGKVQGRDRVGIVEGPVGTAPVGSEFRQNMFYPETCGERRGVAMWLKLVLAPW